MADLRLRGRVPEQAVLADTIAGAADGAAGIVLIDGPAGIGKSRLVQDAARLAAGRGFAVAAARSDELDRVTPLGPLIAALRASEPPILGGDRLHLPGLADQRLWLLDRLHAALEAAAAARPVLISIDDLQWADQATVQAVAALPAQLFSVPIAWILARRPAPVTAAMQALLGRLADLGARRIAVGPLAPDAVAEIATDMLGASPDGPLSRLMDQAQGNPFYLTELLRTLVGTGRVVLRNGQARLQGEGLPGEFHAAVRSHIRGLSPGAQELLQVAAVFGTDFAVSDLAAVMGQPSGRLLGPVLEATGAGLLVEHGPATLGFRHDLIRHAIYGELPGPVRQSLHRDTAAVLSRSGAAASRVAAHLAHGARPGDEEALRLLDRAAAALAPTNPSAAADAACQALDLLPAGDPRRAQAATAAVGLLGEAGRLDEALSVSDAILGEATVSPVQEAMIHLGIRRSWVMTTRRPIQRPVPLRVLEDQSVPRELCSMLLALEASAAGHADLAQAERLSEAASRDAEKSAEPGAMTLALAVQAGNRSARGELGTALWFAEQAHQRMPPGPASFPQWFVGFCLCPLDRFDEAMRFFDQATRDAEQMGSPFASSIADASRAAALLAAGRLDDAAVAAENAIDTSVGSGWACRSARACGYWRRSSYAAGISPPPRPRSASCVRCWPVSRPRQPRPGLLPYLPMPRATPPVPWPSSQNPCGSCPSGTTASEFPTLRGSRSSPSWLSGWATRTPRAPLSRPHSISPTPTRTSRRWPGSPRMREPCSAATEACCGRLSACSNRENGHSPPPPRWNTWPCCCPMSTGPRRSACSMPRTTVTPGRGPTGT